jgi:hypothetical protein
VSYVHDVDAADPAVQQAGRAVKRPAGGRKNRHTRLRDENSVGGVAVVMG